MNHRDARRKPGFDRERFLNGLAARNRGLFRAEFFRLADFSDEWGKKLVAKFVFGAVRGLIRGTIRRARGANSVVSGALWAGSALFEERWLMPIETDSEIELRQKLRLSIWLHAVTGLGPEIENEYDRLLTVDIHLSSSRLIERLRTRLSQIQAAQQKSQPVQKEVERDRLYKGRTLFDSLEDSS